MADVFLHSFVKTDPPFPLSQEEGLQWMAKLHNIYKKKDEPISDAMMHRRFHHYGVKPSKIGTKYYSSADMLLEDLESGEVFSKDKVFNQKYKTAFFRDFTEEYFKNLYSLPCSLPDHMIHVSCTGYVSPSAPQRVVSLKNASTKITHAYHMGCYAAMPAVRMAKSFLQSKESQSVDVIHTELCSLHANSQVHTPEQIVIQSLFADGLIKYSLSPHSSQTNAFKVLHIKERLVEDSLEDMTWEPEDFGFQMGLSRHVPDKIASHLPLFLNDFAKESGVSLKDLTDQAIFAIHPGGPRIIDMVAEKLNLKDHQIASSKKILKERGNMSSATLPHVWEDLLVANSLSHGDLILSLAFGPGLTIFGSLFEYTSPM